MSIGELMRDKFDCHICVDPNRLRSKLARPGFATREPASENVILKKGFSPFATRQIQNGTDYHYE